MEIFFFAVLSAILSWAAMVLLREYAAKRHAAFKQEVLDHVNDTPATSVGISDRMGRFVGVGSLIAMLHELERDGAISATYIRERRAYQVNREYAARRRE